MLGAAVECARNGLPVYPAKPRGKEPLWKGWQRSATTKVESLAEHWRCHPTANVGIACRGLVVLDADSRKGEDAVEELCLPETTRVKTRRGSHWYFSVPGSLPGAKLTALPDVELRGKGQGVLGPGSIHPSGHEYEWKMPPWELPPTPFPDELRGLAAKAGTHRPFTDGFKVFPGGRHEHLLKVAASLRARHGVGEIAMALHGVNLAQCSPPLPEKEVERMAHEAARLQWVPWLDADARAKFCTEDERLSKDARFMLMLLCGYANYNGECFPGVRTLAARAGCRPSSVSRAMKELERFGRVKVDRAGRGKSNRYTVLPWTPSGGKGLSSVTPVDTPEGYLRVDTGTGEIAA
jgi:hypothetical protein